MARTILVLLLILPLLLAACDREAGQAQQPSERAGAVAPAPEPAAGPLPADPDTLVELEWDDLIPADWQPDKLLAEYDADNLDDDDPRAQELMDRLKALWAEAPVVDALDGRRIRLPGFVVPLTTDATEIPEFLLVPYFGACIHVPPPPANQTIHVVTADGAPYHGELFDTVWVEGRMRVTPFSDDLGDAGYRIEGAAVSLYEEE
jgi:hypothetical protein